MAKADRHNKLTNLKEEGRNIKHQLITVQNEQFQLKKHLEAYTDKQSSLFQRIQELNRSEGMYSCTFVVVIFFMNYCRKYKSQFIKFKSQRL